MIALCAASQPFTSSVRIGLGVARGLRLGERVGKAQARSRPCA